MQSSEKTVCKADHKALDAFIKVPVDISYSHMDIPLNSFVHVCNLTQNLLQRDAIITLKRVIYSINFIGLLITLAWFVQ